jgi:flagellar protein FlaJ
MGTGVEMFSKMPLGKTALRLFGKLFEPYLVYLDSVKTSLKRAGMITPVLEYISSIALYSLIGFAVSLMAGSVLISIGLAFASRAPSATDIFYSYTLSIITSFMVAGGIIAAGLYYPSMRSKTLRTKIERSLPFAVFYMSTSASSGIKPVEIFHMLAQRGGIIGKEAERIYSDVSTLGMDLHDALQKAAARSPSPTFADLLWNTSTIIRTGGDLQKYLSGKTKTYMSQYRRNLDSYAKQISFYTEIYTTLVIVGSLFFIVLISIMSPMVGGSQFALLLQTFLVFLFIPAISAGFIVLLKGISPSE